MKILVCITHVPDTTTKISFKNNGTEFNTDGVQFIIGPYDDYALARAVELRDGSGGSLVVLNVGTAVTEPTLRKALAIGADSAVRINAEPTDSWFVAQQIAAYAQKENFDLIMMGRESIDHNGGVVHGLVAELLGLPSVSPVMQLDLAGRTATMAREIEGGKEYVTADLPLVVGCQEPIAEWKIPNMRGIMSARTKPLQVLEPAGNDALTQTLRYELPPAKGACKMIPADDPAQLVTLLRSEAKVL